MRSRHSQLLCVTGGTVHPSILAQTALTAWIRRLPATRVHVVRKIDAIVRLRLDRFAAILLYFHASHIDDETLEALDSYVSAGGGLVAIHSAAASFKDNPSYSAILGGRFLQHGPVGPISIRQTRVSGGFAGGGSTKEQQKPASAERRAPHLAPAFPPMEAFTVRDELYIHEYDPDNFVHFVADTEDGAEPMVWSRLHGKGRVFYLAPGHRTETLRHPAVRNILRYGIRWAMNPQVVE